MFIIWQGDLTPSSKYFHPKLEKIQACLWRMLNNPAIKIHCILARLRNNTACRILFALLILLLPCGWRIERVGNFVCMTICRASIWEGSDRWISISRNRMPEQPECPIYRRYPPLHAQTESKPHRCPHPQFPTPSLPQTTAPKEQFQLSELVILSNKW